MKTNRAILAIFLISLAACTTLKLVNNSLRKGGK